MTLVFMGLRGMIGHAHTDMALEEKRLGAETFLPINTGHLDHIPRRIAGRLLTVGLPFYAVLELGAARVALVLLIGLASNIIAIEDEATDLTRVKTWKLLFARRRWTVGSILLQLVCDLSGLTSGFTTKSICLGYLALATSILVLPPPFPSSRPKASVVTSSSSQASGTSKPVVSSKSYGVPPQFEHLPAKNPKLSPLVCSLEDSQLTLLSGTVLGIFSIIAIVFFSPAHGHFSPAQLGFNSLTSLTAALSLVTTKPKSLRNGKSLGLVLGSLVSSLALVSIGKSSWSLLIFESGLIAVSFVCANLDTRAALFTPLHSAHHHHHVHTADPHAIEHAQMSRFSEFVLRNAPQSQLLHSILVEKDSRRILYFMWSVELQISENLQLLNIDLVSILRLCSSRLSMDSQPGR